MVTRLLVVLLTLVGPLPFRACTCAATPTVCNDPRCPAAPAPKPCSCGHHHEPADEDTDAADIPDALAASHTHPPEHQSGCPSTQVRPTADMAPGQGHESPVAPSVGWLLTAPDHTFSIRNVTDLRAHPPRAPARPLYITLLTLRN